MDIIKDYIYSEEDFEEIQNLIEKTLIDEGYNEIQRAYSIYRMDRTRVRDTKSDLMKMIK